ncbi:MAG: hypothetical protein SAL70_29320 [Scytonema sp. PMC 1070.18]|nr:hypothetical protein [Scytonema sp. PMC 1070.18]
MKYNVKFLLFLLGLLSTIGTSINVGFAQEIGKNTRLNNWSYQQGDNLISQAAKNVKNKELQAFFNSRYDYWDARVLADFWGQSLDEAKARIGRKVLWGPTNVAILDQFLVDARVKALQSANRSTYKFFVESGYTYDDAKALAKFWGDRSPADAKLRIERNLILGNNEMIDQALQYARR